MKLNTIILMAALSFNVFSQSADNFDEIINLNKERSLKNLTEILNIPNVASNKNDIIRNIEYLERKFKALNFRTERLTSRGNSQFYIEKIIDEKLPTVLFYLQLDGQPVDASKWNQFDPFKAVFKSKMDNTWKEINYEASAGEYDQEVRVFARSASDSKGEIAMFLSAYEILFSRNIKSKINIKAIFDTEEEIGSPNLVDVIKNYNKLLKADFIVVLDGPQHTSNKPTLLFGARGIISIRLKTFSAYVPQHSGHYGNYVPNPAFNLAKLLASMKDEYGRVTINGFYDGVNINEAAKNILNAVPDDESLINKKLGIAESDKVGSSYQESLQYPSLNINGMQSAWVGEQARTIVPSSAEARLDIRTVLESQPLRLVDLLKKHIQEEGYYIIDDEPDEEERMNHRKIISFNYVYSYPAFRTDFNSIPGNWLEKVILNAHKIIPVKIRQTGGSIPIAHFINELGIPAVILPTVNPDNNQHSPNENLRLGNYFDGIKTMLTMFVTPIDN